LKGEQDIQNLIQMNRVTRLIHKAVYSARQRLAIHYAHKFIINDKDLAEKESKRKEKSDMRSLNND